MDLPYKAEYAKSGRASCKGCKSAIGQGTLRLAVMVQVSYIMIFILKSKSPLSSFQSPFHDGKNPNWYHFHCFFAKQRPKSTADIEHFESLRLEDQDKIKERVGVASVSILPAAKGKKRAGGGDAKLQKEALKDFTIEYAKSGRAMCRGCEQKILKDEVRYWFFKIYPLGIIRYTIRNYRKFCFLVQMNTINYWFVYATFVINQVK